MGKIISFKSFINVGDDLINAFARLDFYPFLEVLAGCEDFVFQLFNESAKALRWHIFKKLKCNQGVAKLLPTQGPHIENILWAPFQANIWMQDKVYVPSLLEPVSLRWKHLHDGPCVSKTSKVPPAPGAGIDPLSCQQMLRTNNLACTEFCKCQGAGGSCTNIAIEETESENEDDIENDD